MIASELIKCIGSMTDVVADEDVERAWVYLRFAEHLRGFANHIGSLSSGQSDV
jgi:hypothetical protein